MNRISASFFLSSEGLSSMICRAVTLVLNSLEEEVEQREDYAPSALLQS